MKTWFITGASTGLGRCIAENALERGDQVIAASIDPENMADYPERFGSRVLVKHLDVTDCDMVKRVFEEGVSHFGAIDVCVNNAGFMLFGAVEELAVDRVRRLVDTNFFGTFYVSQLAAKHMRERKSGTIIQIASLSAVDVCPGQGLYGATKWAVEGMSLALAQELKPFGVNVVLIEPGRIKTGIESRAQTTATSAYADILQSGFKQWRDGDDSQSDGDPVKCAEIIVEMADCAEPPTRIPLTTFAYEISQMINKRRFDEAEAWKEWSFRADFS